jgi:hypothetical protein
LNKFSNSTKKFSIEANQYYESFFNSFLECTKELPNDAFINKKTKRFNTFIFEALLYKLGKIYLGTKSLPNVPIKLEKLKKLEDDHDFLAAAVAGTTNKDNIEKRFKRAVAILQL